MDEDAFWQIIETANSEAAAARIEPAESLCQSLMKLTSKEVVAFDRVFAKFVDDACRWDLWAAGYIIAKGFDRDGFLDFRAGLVALGRAVYHAALGDPRTLAHVAGIDIDTFDGRVLLAVPTAYKNVTGKPMPPDRASQPKKLTGKGLRVTDLSVKFPELATKFGFRLRGSQPDRRPPPGWACEKFNEHGEQTVCDDCLKKFRAQGSKTQHWDMPPRTKFGQGWFSVGAVHWFDATDDAVFPARDGSRVLARAVCGGICDVTLNWAPRAGRECEKCLRALKKAGRLASRETKKALSAGGLTASEPLTNAIQNRLPGGPRKHLDS
jgi:hypothetical protein